MALFSKKKVEQPPLSTRLEAQYNSASYNLYLIVAFTAINLVLVLTNANSYFLFSAMIPYYISLMAMSLCGKLPEEYYDPMYEYEFLDDSFLTAAIIIAVIITAAYLLCAVFSRKHRVGWLIAALVLFSIDTVSMFVMFDLSADMILDILFHVWVLYYLIVGIIAHYKLKKLPAEPEKVTSDVDFNNEFKVNEDSFNSGFEYKEDANKDETNE